VRGVQLLALHLLSGRLLLEFLEMRRRFLGAMREVVAAARGELEPLRCRGLPLVTVCIPTRNEERFIGQALFALRRVNLYPRLEIIVADYASRDATVEIARRFGAKVVSLDKRGPAGRGTSAPWRPGARSWSRSTRTPSSHPSRYRARWRT
jgi:cellulose synthase/poly-beta-1,6-N-acetylglucosamine synthase-like glycosyltransferase